MPIGDHSADASHLFARAAAQARFEALDTAAVTAARCSILDTLGVSLAATGLDPSMDPFLQVVLDQGGTPQATVVGYRVRTSATLAAFTNGALSHCLDFDDQTPWGQHAGSSVVPAVLAVAERRGDVAGRDVLTAIAVGQDLFARLRLHTGWRKDWVLSSVGGVFAGAAACARASGLDERQTQAALSIASQQAAGMHEVIAGVGSDLRGKYAAFSAKGAVLSTLLAERGVTGVDTLFEGRDGFFGLYFGGAYDRAELLHGLGEDFLGATTLYKKWPAVGTAHSHVHATIQLVQELDLRPEDIARIEVFVGDYHRLMTHPLEQRRAPQTLVDAKFSLPFLVAIAAVRRGMSVWDFTEAGLRDPLVRSVAEKVEPVDDDGLDWGLDMPPGRVRVTAIDGRTAERVGDRIPGSAERPMTWADVVEKFRDNASAAARPPSVATVDRVVDLVGRLEDLDDAAELMRVLG